jgi:predicted nucleic acid-binding protein
VALLDTNVVSELRRPKPNSDVADFVVGQSGDDLYATEITFAEILYGIEQLADPAKRADLQSWLDNASPRLRRKNHRARNDGARGAYCPLTRLITNRLPTMNR